MVLRDHLQGRHSCPTSHILSPFSMQWLLSESTGLVSVLSQTLEYLFGIKSQGIPFQKSNHSLPSERKVYTVFKNRKCRRSGSTVSTKMSV